MNICYVYSGDLKINNGGKTHTVELAQGFANLNHRVFVLCKDYDMDDFHHEFLHPIKIKQINLKGLNEFSFIVNCIFWIILHKREHDIHIVYERMLWLRSLLIVKYLCNIHLVLEINHTPKNFEGLFIKNEIYGISNFFLVRISRWLYNMYIYFLDNTYDYFVVTTLSFSPFTKKTKTKYIFFGANIDIFKPIDQMTCRHELKIDINKKYLLFLGTFYPWQGLDIIIEAFYSLSLKYDDVDLLLVGDSEHGHVGSESTKRGIIKQISELKISNRVSSIGRVDFNTASKYINAVDICIVGQKLDRSGYTPLKLLEYMACGKPVIAPNISGIREIVNQCNCGLLFEPDNPQDLCNKTSRLIIENSLINQMGINGKKCIDNKYNWQEVSKKVLSIFENISKK